MFSTRSDIFLESALVLAACVALLTLLLLGLIVALRWRRAHELRRMRSFEKRWRPVLMAASMGPVDGPLPALASRDQFAFLKLWNYLHESLQGEASQHLNRLARRLKCEQIAQRTERRALHLADVIEMAAAARVLGPAGDLPEAGYVPDYSADARPLAAASAAAGLMAAGVMWWTLSRRH